MPGLPTVNKELEGQIDKSLAMFGMRLHHSC